MEVFHLLVIWFAKSYEYAPSPSVPSPSPHPPPILLPSIDKRPSHPIEALPTPLPPAPSSPPSPPALFHHS